MRYSLMNLSLLINQVRIFLCVDLDLVVSICLPVCGKNNDGFGLDFLRDVLAYCLQFAKHGMVEVIHDIGLASTG